MDRPGTDKKPAAWVGWNRLEEKVTYKLHAKDERSIAEIISVDKTIRGAEDFLDLVANLTVSAVIIRKEVFDDTFFDLKTRVAGEILQKVSNYRMQLAIVGDFSGYTSEALRAFIRESNRGSQVFFVDTVEKALQRIS